MRIRYAFRIFRVRETDELVPVVFGVPVIEGYYPRDRLVGSFWIGGVHASSCLLVVARKSVCAGSASVSLSPTPTRAFALSQRGVVSSLMTKSQRYWMPSLRRQLSSIDSVPMNLVGKVTITASISSPDLSASAIKPVESLNLSIRYLVVNLPLSIISHFSFNPTPATLYW